MQRIPSYGTDHNNKLVIMFYSIVLMAKITANIAKKHYIAGVSTLLVPLWLFGIIIH